MEPELQRARQAWERRNNADLVAIFENPVQTNTVLPDEATREGAALYKQIVRKPPPYEPPPFTPPEA